MENNKKIIRIYTEMLEGSVDQTALTLIAGYLARYHRLIPLHADLEGMVYEADCDVLEELKEWWKTAGKAVLVNWEGTKTPLAKAPIRFSCDEAGD